MAILKLAPALKDYLCGGQRLKEEFGIVNIVNLFRPQMILLGGLLSNYAVCLIPQLQMMMEDQCFGGKYGKIPRSPQQNSEKKLGLSALPIYNRFIS